MQDSDVKTHLNDVIFIWFTNKKSIHIYSHSMINCMHRQQQRRITSEQNALFAQERLSLMVTVGMWKLGYIGLVFANPKSKSIKSVTVL